MWYPTRSLISKAREKECEREREIEKTDLRTAIIIKHCNAKTGQGVWTLQIKNNDICRCAHQFTIETINDRQQVVTGVNRVSVFSHTLSMPSSINVNEDRHEKRENAQRRTTGWENEEGGGRREKTRTKSNNKYSVGVDRAGVHTEENRIEKCSYKKVSFYRCWENGVKMSCDPMEYTKTELAQNGDAERTTHIPSPHTHRHTHTHELSAKRKIRSNKNASTLELVIKGMARGFRCPLIRDFLLSPSRSLIFGFGGKKGEPNSVEWLNKMTFEKDSLLASHALRTKILNALSHMPMPTLFTTKFSYLRFHSYVRTCLGLGSYSLLSILQASSNSKFSYWQLSV